MIKYYWAVLSSLVISLSIFMSWIMKWKKELAKLFKTSFGLIIQNMKHFYKSSLALTYFFIARLDNATVWVWIHVAYTSSKYWFWKLLSKVFCKIFFSSPEATRPKCCYFNALIYLLFPSFWICYYLWYPWLLIFIFTHVLLHKHFHYLLFHLLLFYFIFRLK